MPSAGLLIDWLFCLFCLLFVGMVCWFADCVLDSPFGLLLVVGVRRKPESENEGEYLTR
jgi:hypothetical protein